jgi:hypothetical protein
VFFTRIGRIVRPNLFCADHSDQGLSSVFPTRLQLVVAFVIAAS